MCSIRRCKIIGSYLALKHAVLSKKGQDATVSSNESPTKDDGSCHYAPPYPKIEAVSIYGVAACAGDVG
jgi:hypothetical protein